MKRWHSEKSKYKSQKDLYCRFLDRYKPGFPENKRVEQLGRYRKKHALDCGKPQCRVCHYNKYPNREKHEHEILSDLSFKEQIRELDS